jgi:hypothetical protein
METTAISESCKETPTAIRACVSNFRLLYFCGAAAKLKARMTVEVSRSHTDTDTDTDTLGGTPPKRRPARRVGSYLHNTQQHKGPMSMPLSLFEPTIPGTKPLQIFSSDSTASRFNVAT